MTHLRSTVGAAVFALAALTVPAVASATAPPEPPAPTTSQASGGDARRARLETACARVPRIQTRLDAAIALLQGDADTRGSLAWLADQLATAQGNDRSQLATVLQNRIDVRTARLALLQERAAALTEIASICAAHGVGS